MGVPLIKEGAKSMEVDERAIQAMSNTSNKQRLLTLLFTALKKRYQPPEPEPRPVLEQLLYSVCREGTSRERADRAFDGLRRRFYDWNEIRVSADREIETAIDDLPNAGARAQRLLSLLQEVFETTFSFDLESLHKKGLKQAAKQLARYQAANDYSVSWVLQNSLDGHSVPLDEPTLRLLGRLGLIEADQEDPEVIRASLEHLVPKARGPLFGELLSALADELCLENEPSCGDCPLAADCPTGMENHRTVSAGRSGRPKPR
jgi:endonuclease-3